MSQIGDNVYPNTSFPDSKQVLPTFTDLSAIDQANYINYLKAILNNDLNTASTYLNLITDTAFVNANKINIMSDTIAAIQDLYSSTTTFSDIINNKQIEWQNIINKFNYVGVWVQPQNYDATNTYNSGDVVLYQNKVWRCKVNGVVSTNPPIEGNYWEQYYVKNNMVTYYDDINQRDLLYYASVDITNTSNPYISTQWKVLTKVGDKGDNGNGFNFYNEWDSTIRYSLGELVVYQGSAYSSLSNANQNHNPSTATEWWQKEFEITMRTIPIQSTMPTDLNDGDLWFKLV